MNLEREQLPGAGRALVLLAAVLAIISGCGEGESSPTGAATRPSALSQERVDAALDAAGRYFDNGENDKAEAILITLLERDPANAAAHELLASIEIARADEYSRRGDEAGESAAYAEAYRHYEVILESGGGAAGIEQSAGRVALAAGKTDGALEHFRRAGALDAADPSSPLLEANLLLQLNRVAEARQAIDRAIAIDAGEPYALATLAVVLKEEGNAEEALARMKEARDLARPEDELGLRVAEARLRRQLGDPEAALNLLLPLPERDRAHEGVAAEIAESALALGRHDQAILAWAQRYEASNDWRAALEAARVALAAGQMDAAWQWFRTAEFLAPTAPRLREFYAELRAAGRNRSDGASAPDN